MRKIILLMLFSSSVLWLTFSILRTPGYKKEILHQENKHENNKLDEPLKFMEFHDGIRTRTGETAPAYQRGYKWDELHVAKNHALARKSNQARIKSNGVIEWKERGPGNVPGRTRALYNIPGDASNNTWLAGSATGGIWRTTDGGNTWSERSADFPALPISSFAADQNATIIYAGTGELVSSIYSALGNGIFKSADKGITWVKLTSTDNAEFSIVTRLIVHPTNANIIVATTAPHNLANDNTSAIMRSTDGGVSWTKAKEIDGIFEQVIFAPGNFNVQYASQNGVGVWKSTNAGATWNLSNTGMSPAGRVEIAVSPVNPSKLYASSEGTLSGSNSDLYYSKDAGATWGLLDIRFNGNLVDFFEGQGFYDNTIMCDPFNEDNIFFGGVSLFKTSVGTTPSVIDNYRIEESGTQNFLLLQSFSNIQYDQQRLTAGNFNDKKTVEIRFGPGQTQKAHRFLVPVNKTNGVQVAEFTYANYVNVPFTVWDVAANKQLMVSFRDQNRNGEFDLVSQYLTSDGLNYLLNSREYLYINNVDYSSSAPNPNMTQIGGHEHNLMYNIFPALAAAAVWDKNNLPTSKLIIKYAGINKLSATTQIVADGRNAFDGKNKSNQIELSVGVHPDHHCLIPVIVDQAAKSYKLLLGNDGGVFVSKASANPGTLEGDWQFKGYGYNTSQFYGADKKPGADEYIGGMQDNGTRISKAGEEASKSTFYKYAVGGDGFEVIWNSSDENKIIGSIYNGQVYRSMNGGINWQPSVNGLTPSSSEFSFVTKLANSKNFPDRVFMAGTSGVYVSNDFAGNWNLTEIPSNFVIGTPLYLDVEVSRANANIVWAGSGMNNNAPTRNLFVSQDGGKTFSSTNNFTAVPLGNITKLASHPTNQNIAYALFSFANAPKILRTTNLGQSWQDISGFGTGATSTNGFPDVAVYCLYVRPDNPNIIWVGTEIGIVESQDNGLTWALLNDFPNVSVWDMKGQDDQVVIATHGRGIWTAKIDAEQISIEAPKIVAAGTSPLEKLVAKISITETFDSVRFFIGNNFSQKITNLNIGEQVIEHDNISEGEKELKLIGYIGSSPFQSKVFRFKHLDILAAKNSYATYFTSLEDVTVEEMGQQNFVTGIPLRKTLQTSHNYALNKDHKVTIRTPVTVSSTFSKFFYRDIAIVEPGNDSIVVEATKNGIDWISLKPSYDASFNSEWESAFLNAQPGTVEMFIPHELDIRDKFAAGELLLFRLRLVSNKTISSWGWALDYVSIQEEEPTAVKESKISSASVYPNPSAGLMNVQYTLSRPSEVNIQIFDIYGRAIQTMHLNKRLAGLNTETISLEKQESGTYVVLVRSKDGVQSGKVSLVK